MRISKPEIVINSHYKAWNEDVDEASQGLKDKGRIMSERKDEGDGNDWIRLGLYISTQLTR